MICLFDFRVHFTKTNELVILSIDTFPMILSFNFVGAINLISRDIVTHGLPQMTNEQQFQLQHLL